MCKAVDLQLGATQIPTTVGNSANDLWSKVSRLQVYRPIERPRTLRLGCEPRALDI